MAWESLTEDVAELFEDQFFDAEAKLELILYARRERYVETERQREEKRHFRLKVDPVYRADFLRRTRQWEHQNRSTPRSLCTLTPIERRTLRNKQRVARYQAKREAQFVCVVCNKSFVKPNKPGIPNTCSIECKKERKRQRERNYTLQSVQSRNTWYKPVMAQTSQTPCFDDPAYDVEVARDLLLVVAEGAMFAQVYVAAPAHDGPVFNSGCYHTPCRSTGM